MDFRDAMQFITDIDSSYPVGDAIDKAIWLVDQTTTTSKPFISTESAVVWALLDSEASSIVGVSGKKISFIKLLREHYGYENLNLKEAKDISEHPLLFGKVDRCNAMYGNQPCAFPMGHIGTHLTKEGRNF